MERDEARRKFEGSRRFRSFAGRLVIRDVRLLEAIDEIEEERAPLCGVAGSRPALTAA